jgi:3-deoxy-manno-octulosonate cytidylyltransferase (CMP-KDO synthetase)
LVKLCGKELVLRVWEGTRRSALVDRLIVATDYEPIVRLVEQSGGEAMMTPEDLATGNDRVAWVAERIPSRFVVNVQGDNPLVSPEMLDPLIGALQEDPNITLVVPAKRIETREEMGRHSVVKMVFDEKGRALYFSRSIIPFSDDTAIARFKHVGIYAWRREALFEFASSPRSALEKAENLEMLRLFEKEKIIHCVRTDVETIEIDTPDDVLLFENLISSGTNNSTDA